MRIDMDGPCLIFQRPNLGSNTSRKLIAWSPTPVAIQFLERDLDKILSDASHLSGMSNNPLIPILSNVSRRPFWCLGGRVIISVHPRLVGADELGADVVGRPHPGLVYVTMVHVVEDVDDGANGR